MIGYIAAVISPPSVHRCDKLPMIRAVMQTITEWVHRIMGLVETADERHTEKTPVHYEGPRDAVLVIDASGSMRKTDWKPSRLEAAREAAKAFIKRLAEDEPEARVAVVAYGDIAVKTRELARATNYESLARGIDRISTLGWTNITSGLQLARECIAPSERPVQIVLLSDGHHNRGPKPKNIAATLKQRATIECVGIGSRGEVDEKLLKWIASAYPDGRKRYRWIGDKEQLIKHFRNLGGGLTRG